MTQSSVGIIAQNGSALKTVHFRILSFSTAAMMQQEFERSLEEAPINAHISCAGFGAVVSELLAPLSDQIDGFVIVMDALGFFSRDWRQSTEAAHRLLSEKTDILVAALEGYVASGSKTVFINSLPSVTAPQAGFLDLSHPDGLAFLIHYVNQRLQETAARLPQITLIDADLAMAHVAPAQRANPKLWFYGRIPFGSQATKALAQAFALAIAAQATPPAKVLALDLDGTLWRGIYGEQGTRGLECGDDYPGNAFKAFQEECLRLKSQGFLLTILSKNDADVLRVFDDHPAMMLKKEDFVAHRINWEPKPENIRALAVELDLGLDNFLFLDDSPHEREAMRKLAPQVRVPELPADPALRPGFVRGLTALWSTRLTSEDRGRSEHYAVRLKGRELQREAASFDDYLSSLEQNLIIEPVTAESLPRIAQLHARTNQFNLTTVRLSETDLAAMLADEQGYLVRQGRVADRFGDHGIVICAVAKIEGRRAWLETFLMSCRVIGRDVERAFLGAMMGKLVARGVNEVLGQYIPSSKNSPAEHFYEASGFLLSGTAYADRPGQVWSWNKDRQAMPSSVFIQAEGKD